MKTDKIFGILSLNIREKDNNWGSILQSWALQKVLLGLGINNKIIDYRPKAINLNTARYPFLYNFPFHVKRFFRYFLSDLLDWKKFVSRDNKFKLFIKQQYRTTKHYSYKTFSKVSFDGFFIGSDIVWNEFFWGELEPAFFCRFPNMKGTLNIAYAPSLASNGFSKESEKNLPQILENFSAISVRESSKVNYIKQFTKKDVSLVLDPTLLLETADYSPFIKERLIEDKYILVYCVAQDIELIKYAKQKSLEMGCKLAIIKCIPAPRIKEITDFLCFDDAGIEEWLNLIFYSEIVFTTSFHATIFSILFKKKFYSMYIDFSKSKIVDLMDELGMKNYGNTPKSIDMETIETIDYDKVYKKLNQLRTVSLEFIKKAVKNDK